MLKRAFIAVAVASIRFYQRFLSPLKPMPTCRFLPTCSSYALEAIQRRGAVQGTLMALWRILRCNPFCAGGFDPVEPYHGPAGEEHGCASCALPGPAGRSNRGAPAGPASTRPRMRPVT